MNIEFAHGYVRKIQGLKPLLAESLTCSFFYELFKEAL